MRSGRQGGRVAAGPGGTVEQLQVIAASMAGAGQLVAGDPVHLVALVLDGHGGTGELVLGPDRAGGHGTRRS
ncbi:hypothetical protein [Aeromonas allosaccharophila]|uniref:hypothetical protein n=1 Tax=Aeromonas allosaccharophila TaxID=656 RepID=UPI0012E0C3AF|nr:hypothetical protein [Aeromonas allosaccharophila]